MKHFPYLGFGVGLRNKHFAEFLDQRPASIDWVEALTENYMDWSDGTRPRAASTLVKIRSHVPVVLHGVSLSVGSADPLNPGYLKRLKDLAQRVDPIWISDHLCWTGVNGQNMHDLLPLPYTEEALNLVVEKTLRIQDALKRRILLENVSSYLEFTSEMTEWEFLSEIAQRADCGILLDVNNIFVSSVNHAFDPMDYLQAMPMDRVAQIHLAGHTNRGRYLIDTHDAPVCKEVWDLYSRVCRDFPLISSMIEWDGNIPSWSRLEKEVVKMASVARTANIQKPRVLGAYDKGPSAVTAATV